MSTKKLTMKRRAVSNIIGSLIVLAIVASVGSVILFQGLNQINQFNGELQLHEKERINELREKIVFEHVKFDTQGTGTDLILYLANAGSIDSTIESVSVVKIGSQELIIERERPLDSEATVLVEDNTIITLTSASLGVAPDDIWDSALYGPGNQYKINVVTSKGNVFPWTTEPFND